MARSPHKFVMHSPPKSEKETTKVSSPASLVSDAISSDGDPVTCTTLPLWRKVAFGAGGLPMQMMQNVIGFFLPLFLLETVNLQPAYLSAILLAARISDAVTDPLMGFLVLKTKSRFGQKRPW